MAKPLILIVEDLQDKQDEWARAIGDQADYLQATTIAAAKFFVKERLPDIDLIIMDACVPGQIINTEDMVSDIRQRGFKGPMIAASNGGFFRECLMTAGCSHNSGGKDIVARLVIAL